MITEKKFMLISIRDNKLKVKVDQYNPENNDAFQNTYMNDAPIHEELGLAMQNLLFHVEQLTHSKIPGLYVDGFYRQPSGNSEIINIYAGLRTDTTCPINLAVRVNTGKDTYEWLERLMDDLSFCEREALLYITEGKRFDKVDAYIDKSIVEIEEIIENLPDKHSRNWEELNGLFLGLL